MDHHGRTYSIKGERAMSQGFIAQYAAKAAVHTEGVCSLNTGIVTSIKEAIGLEHEGHGVRVVFRGDDSDDVIITVYIDVRFGYVMPEVAWSVQERVKKDVERYTGLNVDAVNVHVMRVLEDKTKGESRDAEEAVGDVTGEVRQ
ncbi:MAG: Asp23/Gls24 family envelope stress response protein [Clostridiaceae bacterium]|jgi:uncharacterized alkaline shock family protein YloU|nr:Asp23/Gls24 family envelope stress response protein [Clostridiaceae bacterium]